VFLKPGYNTGMATDATLFDEKLTFTGDGATENNLLAKLFLMNEQLEITDSLHTDLKSFTRQVFEYKEKVEWMLNSKNIDKDFRNAAYGPFTQKKIQWEGKLEGWRLEGKASPGFSFDDSNGKSVSLTDFKGKYVFIDIWATWCGPCISQIPYLEQLQERYKGQNIAFVSVSLDNETSRAKWKDFIAKKTLSGTQLIATKGFKSKFIKAYGIHAIPHFILISPEGTVLRASAPMPSDPKLAQLLDMVPATP
jgi:thiol-disulfide isomerase/thioredoxin